MSNRNKRRNKKHYNSTEDKTRLFFVRVIAIWLFILPLIVFFKKVQIPLQMQDLYLQENAVDLFAYWKAVWLWSGASIFFLSALIFRYVYKIGYKLNTFTGALLASAVWVTVSYIASPYKDVAWLGYLDRYEGTISWLSYLMAAYSVHTFASTKEHGLTITKGIVFSAGIVGLIGAFQYIGLDYFKTDIAKQLMLGENYSTYVKLLDFSMPVGMSYTTLYNPNYVGSFVVITIPLILYLITETKSVPSKIIYSLILFSLILSLIGSQSAGGYVALSLVIVVFAVFMLFKHIPLFQKNKKIIGVIIPLAAIIFGAVIYNAPEVKQIFAKDTNKYLDIDKVELNGQQLGINFNNDQTVNINNNNGVIEVLDANGKLKPTQANGIQNYIFGQNSNTYTISVEVNDQQNVLKKITLMRLDQEISNASMQFWYTDQNYYIGKRVITSDNISPQKINLIKNERSFTYRGYIWNRAIPKILNSPLFGYGADTFALAYPQIDLAGRVKAYNSNPLMIIDKPHNLYISIMMSFGIVGLVLYLFIIFHVIKSKNIFFMLTVLGFLVAGIVNDSVIVMGSIVMVIISLYNPSKNKVI